MKKNYFETIIGTLVLFFSVYAFLMFLEVNIKTDKNTTSKISANFLKLGGIIVGNDVKLRGIKIGVVSNVFLDSEYYARVEMEIDSKIKLQGIVKLVFKVREFLEINIYQLSQEMISKNIF